MPEKLERLILKQEPTAERPMLGLTVLVVEDSLYACEAMRLLCLRSGARIRRADSLKSAHRHLSLYQPLVVVVDLGLPDGSGAELIAQLASTTPRVGVILGVSGDADAEQIALSAGADGFLEKPITSLAVFQAAVLAHLPANRHLSGPRNINCETISPDPLALHDDLAHAANILQTTARNGETTAYVAQFLTGIARLADDSQLEAAAIDLNSNYRAGQPISGNVANISGLLRDRLQHKRVI